MGAHGPVPKRSTERRRRNKESRVETVKAAGVVKVPAADKAWHPIAIDLYEGLAESGQAQFFEPSDWAYARLLAHETTRALEAKFSAMAVAALCSGWADLFATEASRRRLRIEIERGKTPELAPVTSISDVRARAGA